MRRLILAAALCAAAATPAFADNEHQQLVNRQMAVWDANYQGQGYSRILSTGSQTANDDAIQSFGMDLTAGVNYAVAGSCDSDCSDLDVIVYGPRLCENAWSGFAGGSHRPRPAGESGGDLP